MSTKSIHQKILCPLCQSRLTYGLEGSVFFSKVVDPNTGKLLKRVTKTKVENTNTRSFLSCENTDCNFMIDDEDEACTGEYMSLFERVNVADSNEFARKVKSNLN